MVSFDGTPNHSSPSRQKPPNWESQDMGPMHEALCMSPNGQIIYVQQLQNAPTHLFPSTQECPPSEHKS